MALASLYRVVQDVQGNIVGDVLGTITHTATGTIATLFADAGGLSPLPNPLVNNPQYGSFAVFLAAGTYNMSFVKAGFSFEAQSNINLRDPIEGVNVLTGTPNRVLVSPASGIGAVTLSTPQDLAPDSSLQFAHLGLGTPATSHALSVSGTSNFAGTLNANSVAIAGGTAILAAATLGDLTVTNNATVANTLAVRDAANPLYTFTTSTARVNGLMSVGGAIDVAGLTQLSGNLRVSPGTVGIGIDPQVGYSLYVQGTTGISGNLRVSPGYVGIGIDPQPGYSLYVQGNSVSIGQHGVNGLPLSSYQQTIYFPKDARHGLAIHQTASDAAGQASVAFLNTGGAVAGFIVANATTTSYATTSDARLKHDITSLTGELALIQALRPVAFRWNLDNSLGHGFLAHEVAAVVAGVIHGEEGAVNEDGTIVPQMIDYARLVPWIVGALQTLVQRLEVVEDAAGI